MEPLECYRNINPDRGPPSSSPGALGVSGLGALGLGGFRGLGFSEKWFKV